MPGGSGGSFWGLAKAKNASRIDRECGGRLPKGSRRFLAMFRFDGGRKTWVNTEASAGGGFEAGRVAKSGPLLSGTGTGTRRHGRRDNKDKEGSR